MKHKRFTLSCAVLTALAKLLSTITTRQAQDSPTPGSGEAGKKPNILFIMGDDIGWFNIAPAWPTVVMPVRIGSSPVMKLARPAVQRFQCRTLPYALTIYV